MNSPKTLRDFQRVCELPAETPTRHDKTMFEVKEAIANLTGRFASSGTSLLEVGGHTGWQTLAYRAQLAAPLRAVIYDWQDSRLEEVKNQGIEFRRIDLETDDFPDADAAFDVVVCNQVFEHIKNIYGALSEIHRVLKTGGFLIFSVPNISALHNCVLLALGKQPTTMAIRGSHIRGYAIRSMTEFLTRNGHFRLCALEGFGLHPFTSSALPWIFKTYCHTPVWVLQKQESPLPTWREERAATFTTTKF
ncbi:MAG TPA: class I SAM-dependent methyltransferase [Terracidiphilus sp.]|nr:class I SAM-dependent methyltransferase [Terracidiphilus sp.]